MEKVQREGTLYHLSELSDGIVQQNKEILQGERPRKQSLGAEVSSELVWSELIPITTSCPHWVKSLVPVHRSHADALSHLSAKRGMDVMEHLGFVFLMLLFMQVR